MLLEANFSVVNKRPFVAGFERTAGSIRLELAYNLGEAIRDIMGSGPRSGHPGTLVGHIRSAPGEALATETGWTEDSTSVRDYKHLTRVWVGGAIPFWEFGPDDVQRPTLRPAIELAVERTFE